MRKSIISAVLALFAASLLFSNVSAAALPGNLVEKTMQAAARVALDTKNLTEAQLRAAAAVLNLTVETLMGSLKEGKTLEELAKNAGVDVIHVYAAIQRAGSGNEVPIKTGQLTEAQLKAVAKVLNLDVEVLRGSLAEGKTLEQLAASAMVDARLVNSALRTTSSTHTVPITTNVLTEAQLKAVAKVLKLDVDVLRGSLAEGKTLEQLAASAGVETWKVNTAIRNARSKRGISVSEKELSANQLKAVAAILNVSVSTLQGSLQEGISLAELAKGDGIDVQLLYDAVNGAG